MKLTLDMTIEEIVKADSRAADILADEGMNCVSCASAAGESLKEAAEGHGVEPVMLLRKLNFRLNM